MNEVELREQIAKYLAPFSWDYDPEWLKSHPIIEQERNKLRERADQILNLIKEAGYLPVEPVQMEVLKDEEIISILIEIMEDVGEPTDVATSQAHMWDMPMTKALLRATIALNEKFGKLYRRRELT